MRKHLRVVLLVILWMGITLGVGCKEDNAEPPPLEETTLADKAPTVADAVAKVSTSVVYIDAEYGRWHSSGTGIFIDKDGYVLTNNHVVAEGYYAAVHFPNNQKIKAEIVYRDENRDIAILKCPSGNYPAVALGSVEKSSLGEDVIAIGFPSALVLGDSASISKGIISAFRTIRRLRYIQTDASIGPGSSGGPLINMHGEVIGINTWKLTESEGINFAIEVDSIEAYIGNTVHQLVDGHILPMKAPPQKEVPLEGVVFQHHGTGSTDTPKFHIGASPWKLFFRPEWDGRCYIEVGSILSVIWERLMHLDVTADRVYQTYVYSLADESISMKAMQAPSDGEWTVWVVEEQVPISSLPFSYRGEGEVRTPPFRLETSMRYRLTYTATWDGDICIGWHDVENNLIMYRSTGSWADFPSNLEAGVTYEYVFDWNWPTQAVYLSVEHAPPISNWMISISKVP